MIRNKVAREHSSRAIRLSTSIGVRRLARMECSWKMRSNLSNLRPGLRQPVLRWARVYRSQTWQSLPFAFKSLIDVHAWMQNAQDHDPSLSLDTESDVPSHGKGT